MFYEGIYKHLWLLLLVGNEGHFVNKLATLTGRKLSEAEYCYCAPLCFSGLKLR